MKNRELMTLRDIQPMKWQINCDHQNGVKLGLTLRDGWHSWDEDIAGEKASMQAGMEVIPEREEERMCIEQGKKSGKLEGHWPEKGKPRI